MTKCGLNVESHSTFLELRDGTKVLSRGRAIDVPIVTAGYSQKTDLTVCSLLHNVDLVLGMTWLVEADPLIRWSLVRFICQTPLRHFSGSWAIG